MMFLFLPILFILKILPLYSIVPVLWVVSIYVVYRLKKFKAGKLFKKVKRKALKRVLKRFSIIAFILIFFTYIFHEERLFTFMFEKPMTYLFVILIYPVLSVIPQELIFRKYFFYRYKSTLFPKAMLVFNSFIFGFVHIIFQNPIAVVFSVIGGYMFARTYTKTNSFTLVCIEHSLYGNLLFTIGLGDFFYHNGNI